MAPSLEFIVGFCTGLLIVLVTALVVGIILWKKRGTAGYRYDERQQLARGKAYRAAYFVALAYFCLNGIITSGAGIEWSDIFTQSIIGIMVSVTVFAIISILNDAYLSLKEKPIAVILLLGVITVANLLIGIINLADSALITNGKLNYHALNFAVGIMLVLILFFFVVKLQMDKKTAVTE